MTEANVLIDCGHGVARIKTHGVGGITLLLMCPSDYSESADEPASSCSVYLNAAQAQAIAAALIAAVGPL